MPWFAIDTELEGHPKFHALLSARRWSTERGLAFFYRLFRTVRLHAVTGDITAWDDRYIGAATRITKPAGIVADLVRTGFVDDVENRRTIHGWMGRNGVYLKENIARAKMAEGGRKGGAARAATAPRDKSGRYGPPVDRPLGSSGVNKTPRGHQSHQSEQEHEHKHEHEPRDSVASSTDVEDLTPPSAAPAAPSPNTAPGDEGALLPLVRHMAAVKAISEKQPDARAELWELCRRHADKRTSADQLMRVASWLWFEHGKHDVDLIGVALARIAAARNPYALLQPGGHALEALVGEIAVARAEKQARKVREDDTRAGLRRGR